jgi:hypothetical protein
MVGVDLRLQNPLDLQVLPPDGFDRRALARLLQLEEQPAAAL